jgi:hypothetical protein
MMFSKENVSPLSSLKLWRANAAMSLLSVATKPMRGGFVLNTKPRLEGKIPRRAKKAKRGSANGIRVKPIR